MTFDCPGCERTGLQQVAGRYEGKPAQGWGGIMICNLCREWGIVALPPKLDAHLKAAGVTLQYREDGSVHVPE